MSDAIVTIELTEWELARAAQAPQPEQNPYYVYLARNAGLRDSARLRRSRLCGALLSVEDGYCVRTAPRRDNEAMRSKRSA